MRTNTLDRIRRGGLASSVIAALAAGLLLAGGAATAADESTRAFLRCMELPDDTARLACYDRLAQEVVELGLPGARRAAPVAAAPPAAEAAAADAAGTATRAARSTAPRSAPEDEFGLPQPAAAAEVSSITARVVDGFTGWSGNTIFVLDNGQVWEQAATGRYEYAGPDREVVISRAILGTFMLSPEGLNRSVRVRRVE
ncbi:MAG: hypothetical protein ACNA8J_11840 [Gammaproteobacteria bacterium]